MSERSQSMPTPEGEYLERNRFAGLSLLLGIIALVALVLCAVGAFVNPHQFSYSWLFAFAFFFTLCAGCFFWTIVHHATDAEWSVVVRRQLENLAALLVVLALLFVPILLLRHHLYAWMDIPPGAEPSLDSSAPISTGVSFLGARFSSSPFSFSHRFFYADSPWNRTKTAIRALPSGCARSRLPACLCLRFV
jgi:hypothetical protein